MENFSMKEAVSGLPVINFHAASMDVASILITASYTGAAGEHCMCSTGCFTKDLKEPVEELKREGVTGAAMEATGVYRKSLYEMPEEADIRVTLINPGHYKNSGRLKTDENDSIRIHPYHSCVILRRSHIAAEAYRELRGYAHERSVVRKQKSGTPTCIQCLLTVMNIRLQHLVR
jgi:transposase